jgi:uncharacterized protein YwgA
MDRRDWLMLFIAFEGAPRGLDPVRLQKGMFLFREEAPGVPGRETYTFRPYNYGPMSKAIYDDLDTLVAQGLVKREPVEGQSWFRYKPTGKGITQGEKLLARVARTNLAAAKHLFGIKQSVASMTFGALLEDVYDRYPDFAANSIFRRMA